MDPHIAPVNFKNTNTNSSFAVSKGGTCIPIAPVLLCLELGRQATRPRPGPRNTLAISDLKWQVQGVREHAHG